MNNKNVGYFSYFNRKWFKKHQNILIWLLNTPIIKYWFRYVMRIRSFDCDIKTKINKITPNSFTYNAKKVGNKLQLTTDFRTHNKYSKRIYYGFKYLWWTLHFLDMITNKIGLKRLNFGLDSLEVYPDPDPETSTVDGYCIDGVNDTTWANLIAEPGSGRVDNQANSYYILIGASATLNQWSDLERAILLFDTSSLTAGATISGVVMSMYGTGKSNGLSASPTLNVYSSNPASDTALASGDFDSLDSTAFCDSAITYAGYSTTAYNDFTFNASGISAISKTGISKLGIREATYDVGATAPPYVASSTCRFRGYFAEQTGTTTDPKLVVTYSVVLSKRVYGYIF